jgi:uncharacterized protein with von Willebrand factor type A (vWA) domain
MRRRILEFVERLRAHGFAISVAETIDAVAAVAAAGVDREVLREALAASLVKDEDDRPTFDACFEEAFPLVSAAAGSRRGKQSRRGGTGEPGERAGGGRGAGGSRTAPPEEPSGAAHGRPPAAATMAARVASDRRRSGERRMRAGERRALLGRPFEDLEPREIEAARELVCELGARLRGRLARRERRRRRGRLDVRRMLRAATASGGVPLRRLHKSRRPDRADLVALVDLSGSVATASELCLGLVAPAAEFFHRVSLFAYVDHLCPIVIEDGHVIPQGRLDLHGRSDFGQVLEELWTSGPAVLTRRTLVLVVGDARNNRRPPRADLLRRLRDRVQRVVWLVPEPRRRWNTGDSVLGRYAPACDAVFECESLGALLSALRATL